MKAIEVTTFEEIESFPGRYLVEKFRNFENQLAEETVNDEALYVTADIAIILQGLEIHETNIDKYVGRWKGKNVYLKV